VEIRAGAVFVGGEVVKSFVKKKGPLPAKYL
jgi:hypothetical protein